MTPRHLQLGLFGAGAVTFALALVQPVWVCSAPEQQLSGVSVLIMGVFGLLYFDPRWFCNVAVVLSALAAIKGHRVGPLWVVLVSAALASSCVIGPYFCSAPGGALGPGTALGLGGWLWIASLWLAAASVITAAGRQPLKAPRAAE
jgi:hypothetical protein